MALELTTAGESHGPGLTCIVQGMPAGLRSIARCWTAIWRAASWATAAAAG